MRAGGERYGYVIHFSYGFHPAVRPENLMESIRVPGNSAVGFGLPWWEPGGGENHPDGITTMQSIWIEDVQIVEDGMLVLPKSQEPPYADERLEHRKTGAQCRGVQSPDGTMAGLDPATAFKAAHALLAEVRVT